MPTEALILRRTFPVPVTFADLRAAYALAFGGGHSARAEMCRAINRACARPNAAGNAVKVLETYASDWHAAIKESTGALDEVYAVIDGREVRVAVIAREGSTDLITEDFRAARSEEMGSLLIKADEAGYWQRPHEVCHVLEESQMSHKTMARIAANSIAAGVK